MNGDGKLNTMVLKAVNQNLGCTYASISFFSLHLYYNSRNDTAYMHIDLQELIKNEVISSETADRIETFYKTKRAEPNNKLFVIFGTLGALLVGMGIILIIAHNWDDFPKTTKTAFAFIPLLIGQGLCAYTLAKQPQSLTWREGAAVFLTLMVGASISLVAQIYNISGDLPAFILTWALLALPLVYIMRSSMTSLLYIVAITYFCVESGYWHHFELRSQLYWPLLLLLVPHYYSLYKTQPEGNFTRFHHWFVAISIGITLGTTTLISKGSEELLVLVYMGLYALFYLFGQHLLTHQTKAKTNAYVLLGSFGTALLLLFLTFDVFWKELYDENLAEDLADSSVFYVLLGMYLLVIGMWYIHHKPFHRWVFKPMEYVFMAFTLVFISGLYSEYTPIVLCNLLVLVLGVLTVRQGVREDHLGILNYGLLTLTALVICRFFDRDLSFVLRGFLFIAVGSGFFFANYYMLKKRKHDGN